MVRGNLMATGKVKFFNMQKGFDFITPDDSGADVFVHISVVHQSGLPELRDGQAVEFQILPGKNGKTAAANLKLR
jgi:cold shock protein